MRDFRAIIIGIDHYEAKAFRDLHGPVRDAVRFANWLLTAGVDPDDIHLFLAAAPGDTPTVPATVHRHGATQAEIRHALVDELAADAPRRLCLFWGGHGMIKRDGQRRLFFADVSDHDFAALDLADFLESLITDQVADPARLQRTVIIVDACANYAEMKGLAGRVTSHEFSKGNNVIPREHFSVLGASAGEYAKDDKSLRTGAFSNEFLEALKPEKSLERLFDLEPVVRQIRDKFDTLRADGQVRQRPDYFGWRPWKSSQDQGTGSMDLAEVDAARRIPGIVGVSMVEMSELMKLVALIDPPVPEDVSTQALTRVLRSLQASTPTASGLEWFRRCLEMLAPRPPANILEFLELCRPHLGRRDVAQKIAAWETAFAQKLRIDLAACRAQTKSLSVIKPKRLGRRVQILVEALTGLREERKAYHLHICVPSETPGEEPILFRSAARPYTADAVLRQRQPDTYSPALCEDFGVLFSAALDNVEDKTPVTVETLLPNELLDCGAEDWGVIHGAIPLPLGLCFPIALRSFERHYDCNYNATHAAYRSKWKRLQTGPASGHIAWVEEPPRVDFALLKRWMKPEAAALCALTVRAANADALAETFFAYLVSAGVPAALWLREHRGVAAAARLELENSFVCKPVSEWLETARVLRGLDQPKIQCSGIALMWDDPDQPVPERPRLEAPK